MNWRTRFGRMFLIVSLLAIGHTAAQSATMSAQGLALQTQDGLRLELSQDGRVAGCKVGEHVVPLAAPGGLAILDYHRQPAPDKPVFQPVQGTVRAEGTKVLFHSTVPGASLELQAVFSTPGNCVRVDGQLKDTSGKDRAIAVRFELPLDATGWTWHDDIEEHRVVNAPEAYRNTYKGLSGEGSCSVYPWSALSGPDAGLSLGLPLDQGPRIFVIEYDQTRHVYALTFYLGLTAGADKFRSVAPFSLVLYRHDPAWGMRSAAARFYDLFPQSFQKRATHEAYFGYCEAVEAKTHQLLTSGKSYGMWEHRVDDASDFGEGYPSLYHTGACYSSFNFPSTSATPPSDEEVAKRFQGKAGDGLKRVARDEHGGIVYIQQKAWQRTDKGWRQTFRLNEDPEIVSTKADKTKRALEQYAQQAGRQPFEAFLTADAIEGYFANQLGLDYSPEHIRTADYPPSFGSKSLKVALPNTVWDFLHAVWQPLSAEYQVLVSGNCNRYEQAFTLPFVDIVVFEHYWDAVGRWERYLRTMSRQKPIRSVYLRGDTLPGYMKRGLVYSIFPSVYAVHPLDAWRASYRQYVPAMEQLSAAGWQPIPYARTGDAMVVVERFGDYRDHCLHFTLRNYAAKPKAKDVNVSLDLAGLGVPAEEAGRLMVCDLLRPFEPQPLPAGEWKVHVEAGDSRAFWIGTPEGLTQRSLALVEQGLRRVERLFRADLTEANRAALAETTRLVTAVAAEPSAGIPGRVEELQNLLDRLQLAIATPATVDRDKVFYRLKTDLALSLVGALGIKAGVPRVVEGVRGAPASVRATLSNTGGQPLAELRLAVLSPWKEVAQASRAQDAPTEVLPGDQKTCTFALFAPADPQRTLLPFLLECKGRSGGKPFTLHVPVDLMLGTP